MSRPDSYHYRAFGLNIRSELAMAELCGASPVDPDLIITRSPTGSARDVERRVRFAFRSDADVAGSDLMVWPDVGAFEIRSGIITYHSLTDAGKGLISLPLLGPVMAVLLHRRGHLVLHGSAIEIADQAAVFIGDKGAGKSTTAAALVRSGHPLITDDLVAIETGAKEPDRIWPAYPQVKLTTTATEALPLAAAKAMPSPHPAFPKHRHLITGDFSTASTAIGGIYVLERGSEFSARPLLGSEALVAVLRFSYLARFGEALLNGSSAGEHFRRAARLSKNTPIYRLTVPDGLDRLEDLGPRLETLQSETARTFGSAS